jgi:hypothetical protein
MLVVTPNLPWMFTLIILYFLACLSAVHFEEQFPSSFIVEGALLLFWKSNPPVLLFGKELTLVLFSKDDICNPCSIV